jgi:hypothetical protein
MKRSMTEGENTTSARSSRPLARAKPASLLAANIRALARPGLGGAVLATTSRAKAAVEIVALPGWASRS